IVYSSQLLSRICISLLSIHDALPISSIQAGQAQARQRLRLHRLCRYYEERHRQGAEGMGSRYGGEEGNGCRHLWWTRQWRQVLQDRKSTRLNSSHQIISYAVFCLKKK